ncbi:molybdopterin-binding protein [Pseudorhizobium flavum]|uniref:Molybdopterin molybdenumtransferase n=1 Tax=Pseudorhizobium flavum TaxID=1335061 RepID=A0A7W9Z2Y2_9HYPH|nr:molybdopterin-binding protein [Pseudorhizobium flavum]MBB6181586.1 molybdopterin biosynthesis enzyme [Pseudorhizobium flavum]CAD6619769.1 molybdopterin-binding protein [Pseudorhizobium flavum]
MMANHHSRSALTSLDVALATLLDGAEPVAPRPEPLNQALGSIAAAMPANLPAFPLEDTAIIDGWACCALDLVGASGYSPVALSHAPAWVNAGDAMPRGCDCVLQADLVDCTTSVALAVGEAAPGQGVRREGEDMQAHRPPVLEGRTISPADLLIARKAGLSQIAVRRPRVRLIDVAAGDRQTTSLCFLVESMVASNASVVAVETTCRDAPSIAAALAGEACDLLVMIGGTGDGLFDATAEALRHAGALIAHRIAVRPGETSAIGRLGSTPVVALAGAPESVLAGYLVFVQPLLDRLSGRSHRQGLPMPLARKIASKVGISEVVLLAREKDMWMPLAVGTFPLEAIRLAEAWLVVPGNCEGYDAETVVAAMPLRNIN